MLMRSAMVFILAIICESFYTRYAYYVARADLIRGPASAGAIAVLKAILVIQYVHEPVTIAALALGQILGTYLTLKFIKRGE